MTDTPTVFPEFPTVKMPILVGSEQGYIRCDFTEEEYYNIKHACNAYDDLFAALEKAKDWIIKNQTAYTLELSILMPFIDDALAKARAVQS